MENGELNRMRTKERSLQTARLWTPFIMKKCIAFSFFIFYCSFFIHPAAAAGLLTYRYQHHIFTIAPADHPEWRTPAETWTYNGVPIEPQSEWRVDGDKMPDLPPGIARTGTFSLDRDAIGRTIKKTVAAQLDRPAGSVVIRREKKPSEKSGSGSIVFDGVGLTGRVVDISIASDLTAAAIERGLTEIELPVVETQPEVRVEDSALVAQGIREVVTIGESFFAGSPVNRRHNIGVGLRKFNGTTIAAGEVFSFNKVLGAVNAETGYRKELVIKGDRTEPDFGGGLCQISTTAYRGIWEYGFPIFKRKNHSYTVRYYAPPGTDATVYPGSVDMVFKNNLPGALLIQTHQEKDRAYFIYYGTRDARKTELVGPFLYDRKDPPPDRTELTTDLPPGEKKKLNERVPGLKSVWYRFVTTGTGSRTMEAVYSHYEARPLFTALGVLQLPEGYAEIGSGALLPQGDIRLPIR